MRTYNQPHESIGLYHSHRARRNNYARVRVLHVSELDKLFAARNYLEDVEENFNLSAG